tara:strand:- start:408 stop:908 length:501 start_codon:yes stop_codon:yes gene_type:complete
MNKKDLIKALGAGLLFGLIVFVCMQVFIFFIDEQTVEYDDIFNTVIEDVVVKEVTPPMQPPIDPDNPKDDVAMVTFKYEIRIQNSYDDQQLELLPTIEDVLDYFAEYTRFHEDLYVYDIETRELVLDSRTYNQVRQELATKEDLLIEASQNPKAFTDEEIFNLLVD